MHRLARGPSDAEPGTGADRRGRGAGARPGQGRAALQGSDRGRQAVGGGEGAGDAAARGAADEARQARRSEAVDGQARSHRAGRGRDARRRDRAVAAGSRTAGGAAGEGAGAGEEGARAERVPVSGGDRHPRRRAAAADRVARGFRRARDRGGAGGREADVRRHRGGRPVAVDHQDRGDPRPRRSLVAPGLAGGPRAAGGGVSRRQRGVPRLAGDAGSAARPGTPGTRREVAERRPERSGVLAARALWPRDRRGLVPGAARMGRRPQHLAGAAGGGAARSRRAPQPGHASQGAAQPPEHGRFRAQGGSVLFGSRDRSLRHDSRARERHRPGSGANGAGRARQSAPADHPRGLRVPRRPPRADRGRRAVELGWVAPRVAEGRPRAPLHEGRGDASVAQVVGSCSPRGYQVGPTTGFGRHCKRAGPPSTGRCSTS